MNRVAADRERRANENGEPARKRTDGASFFERKGGEPDPIDAMRETADTLVRIAAKTFMQMRNVDYETAQRWIAGAAAREPETKKLARESRKARQLKTILS